MTELKNNLASEENFWKNFLILQLKSWWLDCNIDENMIKRRSDEMMKNSSVEGNEKTLEIVS